VRALTDEQIRAAAADDPDAAPIPVHATPGLSPVVNPKRLRDRLGLTQEEFAARYRIPVGTLRDWEQGRKRPDAPARAYLAVIDRDPLDQPHLDQSHRLAMSRAAGVDDVDQALVDLVRENLVDGRRAPAHAGAPAWVSASFTGAPIWSPMEVSE